jgi:hypothetical protein
MFLSLFLSSAFANPLGNSYSAAASHRGIVNSLSTDSSLLHHDRPEGGFKCALHIRVAPTVYSEVTQRNLETGHRLCQERPRAIDARVP